jgi:DNA-binding MarR family transcriptional regulator
VPQRRPRDITDRPWDLKRHNRTAAADDRHALRVHLRIATCYNLLMREARRRVAARWQLTLPQFDVLAELARSGERGFTFLELSRLLLVTSGNLTGIVDRLEARHLVRRIHDETDRRVVRVSLTPKGRAMTSRILPRHARDLAQVLGFMPIAALKQLAALLDQMRHGLTRRDAESG